MIADDFSAELAEGLAYVAGYDDESRPVLVIFTSFLSLIVLFFSELKVCDVNLGVYRFSAWNKTIKSCILRNCKLYSNTYFH